MIDKTPKTEDYIFPRHVNGRGSKVTHLPSNKITVYREISNYKKMKPIEIDVGLLSDLQFFMNKIKRCGNVPELYLHI